MKKRILSIALLVMSLLILSGCMPGDGSYTSTDKAGFFWGIWHGWIAPISLITGLFNKDIKIYEVMNTGWWYDFGYYMAIISGFGSLSLARKKERNK